MSHDLKANLSQSESNVKSGVYTETLPPFGDASPSDPSICTIPRRTPLQMSLSFMIGILVFSGLFIGGRTLIPQAVASDGPNVDIAGWTQTASLPVSIASRSTLVIGDHIYLFGGRDNQSSSLNTIYRSQILTNGTLGPWTTAGTLPKPLYLHTVVPYGEYVYVIGGWNTTEPIPELRPNNAVWRGEVLADGRIDNWVSESTYPYQITLHQSVVVNQRIYVLGGFDGLRSRPLNTVYFADIDPGTGQLSAWQPSTELPNARRRAAAAATTVAGTTYIYLSGGSDGDTDTANTVYYAAVHSDGALGSWQSTLPLPDDRRYHASIIHDGRLLIIGGEEQNSQHNTVFASSINADGSLAGWQTLPPLPTETYRFAAASITRFGSDYLAVIGGLEDGRPKSTVYHSTIPNTPTPLPTSTPTPTATPTPALSLTFDREPNGWIGPGESVAYTIEFQAPAEPITSIQLESQLPQNLVLLPDSLSGDFDYEYAVTGNTILWQIGDLEALDVGTITYELARPTPAPPPADIPVSLSLNLSGPAVANSGQPIEYRLEIRNQSVIPLTDIVVVNTVPFGASYLGGSDSSLNNGEVSWQLPILAPFMTKTLTYTVAASHSLLNNRYRVTSQEGASAVGAIWVTTNIDDRRPLVGDDFFVVHNGAQISWESNNSIQQVSTAALTNPFFSYYLPVHTVSK